MIIRMYPTDGLKGQQITAQGVALGVMAAAATPCKGKSIIPYLSATSSHALNRCFCPFRAVSAPSTTQGDALGYLLIPPSGRCRVIADNHLRI